MKNILVLLITLAIGNFAYALQDDRIDDYSFESSELKTESTPYFAIAGGATFTFQFANFDAVNNHLKANNFNVGEFSGQVNLWGGEGFTGLVYVPNLRMGFFSYGGSKVLANDSVAFSTSNVKREVEYTIGLTGISLEYAYVPLKSFAIVGGLAFGKGDISIQTYHSTSETKWEDFKPDVDQYNNLNLAEANYWFVKPNVHFEYALTNFLMFRFGASYNYTFGSDWNQNYSSALKNVPDDLNANALQLQAGIFLGLFNY